MRCLFCNNKLEYKIFDFIIDIKKNDSITDKIYYCKFCPKGKVEKNYFSSLFTARGTGDDIHSYHIRLNRILKNKIICIDVYNSTDEITISLIHYNKKYDYNDNKFILNKGYFNLLKNEFYERINIKIWKEN